MKNRAKWNNTSGFTLLEMMVTVVVIVVLLALAMIPISKMQKDIRQTELDSRAEMIFTAVQNRMARLQAAGQSDVYTSGRDVKQMDAPPSDAEETEEQRTLVYVTSGSKADEGSAADWLYPETEAEAELWNGHWVVEYDAKGGSVYAVFYSKEPMNCTADDFNKLRSRSYRVSEGGAKIGYYGGDSVGAAETNSLTLTVKDFNREKLQVVATCERPAGVTGLKFYAAVEDESSHTTGKFAITKHNGIDIVEQTRRTYTVTLTLDDLSKGKNLRFGQQARFKDNGLVPGENLTVKIWAEAVGNPLIEDALGETKVNSLFADVETNGAGGRTAVIKYGRHLQNLEEASGLNRETGRNTPAITAALQEQDISFGASSSWAHEYDDRKFTPIENAQLKSYKSTGEKFPPAIYDLTVETDGDAGLFKTFGGEGFTDTLKNIRLVDAKITGTGTVGGLVGKLTGKTEIDGCQVYLKNVKGGIAKEDIFTNHTRIGGTVAGGLVGSTEGNILTIRDSLAATVIRGETAAGGLIGDGGGNLTMDHSYADCYLYSDPDTTETDAGYAGGLIGQRVVVTATLEITDCYTAGFLVGKTTAGLVACDLTGNTLENVYSACAPLTGESLTYGTAANTSNASGNNKVPRVYYLGNSEKPTIGEQKNYDALNAADPAKLLSNAFTKQNGDTHAYNLMSGLGLSQYSYPRLAKLPHYGDWQAKFEDKALVYYERYGETDYGFFGANISALSKTGAVGDGYGIIYGIEPKENVKVTVNKKDHFLQPKDAKKISVTDKDGTTRDYYLLPLPAELVQNVETVPEGFYTKLTVDGKDYYYNPHFASTAVTDGSKAPTQISIRTARHLYALSEYYDKYREILSEETVFRQECDIDYAAYDWANYGKDGKPVTEQKPIGRTETAPFKHSYDGGEHIITGVSFASETNDAAVGLFGFVTGTLENIVVTTSKKLADAPTSKLGGSVQRRTVYIGVLAGKNSGTIRNCAVSGYKLSCYAYSGSTCYIGGLVGYNAGTVSACSAAIPGISGNTTNARGYYAGALAGVNAGGGYIRQSYALGSIELREIRGSAVISGFVGDNQGTIRNSYCASALSAVTGAEVNGFASAHGSVSNCYYLSGGTHTFAGAVRLYDYEADTNGAQARNHEQMKNLASELVGFATVDDKAHSINHQNTDDAEKVYPYPSSVTAGSAKTHVHYGDWPTPADMGTIGMVYWEKEEGGANSGYHFSYIGFDAKGVRKEGSSLCTAHDDGGKITDFGYGYYKVGTDGSLTSWSDNFVRDGKNIEVLDGKNIEAAAALAQQVSGYTFTCYQTGEKGLRLKFSNDANGTWTLTQGSNTYTYAVCPFFGDSYCPVGEVGDAQNLGKKDAAKQYQIRSVKQLQFINWSYFNGTGSVSTDVTRDTYQDFPYLQYTTTDKNQSRADAQEHRPQRSWTQTHDVNGVDMENPTNGEKNTPFHPIAGAIGVNENNYSVTLYAWFGGKYDGGNYYIKNIAIKSNCYNVGVFGTTAGATIENIVLYSDNGGIIQRSSTVTDNQCAYALGGLAGIAYEYADERETSGAVIQNCAIAGYKIQDNSQNKLGLGEAVVGGLVGVSSLELDRCSAVADIAINCTHLNSSKALDAPKYGNFIRVGGLVGGVRGKVTNCYTGGKIEVSKDTLKERVLAGWDNSDNKKFAGWEEGENENTAQEVKMQNPPLIGKWFDNTGPDTYVYIGGIGGSGFSSTFVNFGASQDGNPNFENCYTYMTFPKMQGTITAISLIGSVADRYGQYASLTITNCYYLESSADINFRNLPKYHWSKLKSLSDILDTEPKRQAMLRGDLSYLKDYTTDGAKATYNIKGLTPLTYTEMSNRLADEADNFKTKLGAEFGWVTNVENNSTIHGKYSFPGGDTALQGQDYPFPTVLTQKNSLGETVNLHYGAWPKVGMFWSQGIVSMDLIADYGTAVAGKSAIKLELNLSNVSNKDDLTGKPDFTYTDEGVVTASATRITEGNHKGDFEVTLTGSKTGATEVIAKYGDYTARLMVAVTADLKVVLESDLVKDNQVKLTLKPAPVTPTPKPAPSEDTTPDGTTPAPKDTKPEGGETTPEPAYGPSDPVAVTPKLVDKRKNEIKADKPTLIWEAFSADKDVATCEVKTNNTITVTGVTAGETQISITATYKLNGKEYTTTKLLPVTVKEPDT